MPDFGVFYWVAWGLCLVVLLVWGETVGSNSIFDMTVGDVALVLFLEAFLAFFLAIPVSLAGWFLWVAIAWIRVGLEKLRSPSDSVDD